MATDEERLSRTVFTEALAEWRDRLHGGGGDSQVRYIDIAGQDGGANRPTEAPTRPSAERRTPRPRQEPEMEQIPLTPAAEEIDDAEILPPQDLESAMYEAAEDVSSLPEAIAQPLPEDVHDVLQLHSKELDARCFGHEAFGLRNKEGKAGAKGKELNPRYFDDEEWRLF